MKKNTSRTYILSVLLIAITILLNSCSGLFGGKVHNDDDRNTAGERILRLSADTSNRNGSRSVWPGQDYNPNITAFTDFKLISDSPISSITSWETYGSFNGSSIILNPTRSYTLRLTAKYKGGEWSSKAHTIPAGSSTANISFVLEPTGTGIFDISLDVTEVAEQAASIRLWISDTPVVNRTTTAPTATYDPNTTITWTDTHHTSGRYYALFEILDQNGASTIVGPETVYVFPGQDSVWAPVVTELNRKYKITFSLEGFEVNNNTGRADKDVKITANLVPGADFPEPYVQNIYETTRDLPNYDNELDIQDLFLPPTGYYFYRWWDGETLYQSGQPNAYSAGSPIRGGTFTDDITLYPLWIKGGNIYGYSTKEEIEAYITAQSQDSAEETITITFNRGFEESENNRTAWNTTIAALADSSVNTTNKKVDLQLNYLDRDWLIENVFPDPENPENPTPFTRIAGTKAEPNNWLESINPPYMSKIPAYAFYYCTALKSVSSNIDTPSEIGAYAFFNCSSFTQDLTSKEYLITIGEAAFSGSAITSITFARGLQTIGDSAFENCIALTTITTQSLNKLETIGNYAFKNTGISSISVKSTVTSIGDGAFTNCANLQTVKLPSDIEYIGKDALLNVPTIDTSNLTADSYPWYSYSYSEDEINSTSTSELGICETTDELVSALRGTDGSSPALRKKYIPTAALSATNLVLTSKAGTTHYGLAFSGEIASVYDLSPLQNLTVGAEGATIGLDLSRVTINDTTGINMFSELPNGFFAGYDREDDNSNAGTFTLKTDSGTAIGKVLKSIKLPQNLTAINGEALSGCPNLESVTIPSSVKNIYNVAFYCNQNLKEVIFEENSTLEFLGAMAFAYTPSLKAIPLPNSLKELSQQVFLCSGLERITIPDNADFTSNGVFYNCKSLKNVVIGSAVTMIDGCFEGCSSLETFEIKGHTSDWYIRTANTSNGLAYNISSLTDSSTIQSKMLDRSDDTMRSACLYSSLTAFANSTVDTMNFISAYYDQIRITLQVPFDSWEELAPLAGYNGSTPCTIDLSGATTTREMPEDFLNGKDSITVIPPGGAAATVSFTYDLEGFSFKSSFSYPAEGEIGSGTYQINQFEQDNGTTSGTLLLYNLTGVSESDLKDYLKTIILKYSDKAPLNPTEKVNYTLFEGLMEENNTITETQGQAPTDYDLFKIVTYKVNLGKCDGSAVKFTEELNSGWGIHEYSWNYYAAENSTFVEIFGYEGSALYENIDEFRTDFLSHTNAADKTSRATVENLPAGNFQGIEVTVSWINPTPITTVGELKSAADVGGTYALGADIKVSEPIPINASLSLLSVAGQTHTIIRSDDWTISEEDREPGTSGFKPMLYTNGSDINLTMENIILDGGYESEDIISSDSGLLNFSGNEIILTNVTFQNNWKDWDWANFSGLNLNCTTAVLDNCKFENLHISGSGSRAPGINILKGDVTIKDCVFGNNTVPDGYYGGEYEYGRDIWIDVAYSGGKVTITGTTRHLNASKELEIAIPTDKLGLLEIVSGQGNLTVTEIDGDNQDGDGHHYFNGEPLNPEPTP
ncbi:MAG: leucine-rich repeat domain-containing protein [Treponemataceae bacterium]|nr:leucine-rich repeat domain-containing protein [Treponemataceae bacterium]